MKALYNFIIQSLSKYFLVFTKTPIPYAIFPLHKKYVFQFNLYVYTKELGGWCLINWMIIVTPTDD